MSLGRIMAHRAVLQTFPVVQEALLTMLVCSTGGAVGRATTLASLTSVVAGMALLLKFELPGRTVHNTATIIQDPCYGAADTVFLSWSPALGT